MKFRSQMDAHEVAILRSLVTSLVSLLEERQAGAPQDELAALTGLRTGHSTPPEDATLARLLPDFYRPGKNLKKSAAQGEPPDLGGREGADTADLNGALRSLHEPDIIDDKRHAARVLLSTLPDNGGDVTLTPEQADAWLAALNDVRLALGAMLNISQDTPDEITSDDPRAAHLEVYQWLTVMQESLVLTVMP